MKNPDKKELILNVLKKAKRPLTLTEVLSLTATEAMGRSVRRWLQEFVALGKVTKIGERKGARYLAVVLPAPQANLLFTEKSEQALAYVKQPIYVRTPVSYHADWLQAYQPNVTFYLNNVQRALLKQKGERSGDHEAAGTYARHIYNRLLIDLSYNSSRLEGNTYSLIDTEKLIIEGIGVDNKLDSEKIMILNHKEAIRYLVENAGKLQISSQEICTLHFLLADGLLSLEQMGKVRNHGVKIGGSTYIPLDNVEKLEKTLDIITHKASLIKNPYEQSFFLLTHLAYLQAFEDCNKRTSRLSANIPLIRENLVPLSFNDVPKDDYASAMIAVYELNDIGPLAELYCFSYLRTCEQYHVNAQAMGFDRIRVIYRLQRREIIRHIILNRLKGADMTRYILAQTTQKIPQADRELFAIGVDEELKLLSPSRIAGLGVSVEELLRWQGS